MNSKEKSGSKIKWFFFVVFIPVVFTVILAVVIVSFLGYDVMNKAKELSTNIPFISESGSLNEPNDAEKIILLGTQVEELKAELDKQSTELKQKDEELAKVTSQVSELEQSNIVDTELISRGQKEREVIAKTYEAMSPKNAAAILSELPNDEALVHISQVSIDMRASILAKMDSGKAADLMSQLANQ